MLQRLRPHLHLVALCSALLLATASWFGARHYLALRVQQLENRVAERHARTRVLVAGMDLPSGTVLTTAALAARTMPVRYVPSRTARVDDLERVAGQRLLVPLQAGDPVPWTALAGGGDAAFSTQLAPGRRALTLPVDDVNAIAGLLVPGDLIDLLYTERAGADPSVRPLLQKVPVLATGTATAPPARSGDEAGVPADTATFATVTLSVTPEEAQRIVLAQRAGELTAVLRHPADALPVAVRTLDVRALLGTARRVPAGAGTPAHYVEMIVGGARAGGLTRVREALETSPMPASPPPAPPAAARQPPPDAGNVRARLGLAAAARR